MKKHARLYTVILAVLLAAALLAVNVYAGDTGIPEDEISRIVNTQTDQSKVTSPFIDVVNRVRNSVVGVNNYKKTTSYSYGFGYGFGTPRQSETKETLSATGSGVTISAYGHVLTNYHVIESASRVSVTTYDGEELDAVVVNYDANQDLAVLQVDGLKLDPVELGDSDRLQVGEWAIVIGNPMGENYARSVSVGVVSALDRTVSDTSTDRYGRKMTINNMMIQTDAAINSGNSGGGMFNTLGQLQGIPARYLASSYTDIDNIGMCIPINTAKPLIEAALRQYNGAAATETQGEQKSENNDATNPLKGKPRLGVTITSITSTYNGILPVGALVTKVDPNSPAELGGMQVGDIIVDIDGEIIKNSTALQNKIGEYSEGDIIKVTVFRDEGLAAQMENEYIDLSQIGEGGYVELSVELHIVDDLNM